MCVRTEMEFQHNTIHTTIDAFRKWFRMDVNDGKRKAWNSRVS